MFLCTTAFISGSSRPMRMHAAQCPGLISRNAGLICEHSEIAYGHRVRNRHPDGGSTGDGTSPVRTMRLRGRAEAITGTAEINATVYGINGRAYSSDAGASSTILPRYMTQIRSEICCTALRSWEMNRNV